MIPVPRKFSGSIEKVVFWGVTTLFGIMLAMISSMYTQVRSDAREAKDAVIKLEAGAAFNQQSHVRMEAKIDKLSDIISELLMKRLGYVPPQPKL